VTGWNADLGDAIGTGRFGDVTLVDGSSFAVSSRTGDFAGATHGLYLLDTRILNRYRLQVDGRPVEPLSTVSAAPFTCRFVGRVPRPGGPVDSPLIVIRSRSVGNGMTEVLQIRNYATEPATVDVELAVGADFAGLFAVKSAHGLPEADAPVHCAHQRGTLCIRDTAAELLWETEVGSSEPGSVHDGALHWRPTIGPGERWRTCIEVTFRLEERRFPLAHACSEDVPRPVDLSRLQHWPARPLGVECDDPIVGRAVQRAHDDLCTLRIFDPTHVDRVVVAAGAPWYMTLFGRDALLTAWMALPLGADLALGVLEALADLQGTRIDPVTEEQPGRILHEVRYDRATMRTLGGRSAYYGSIDATPLFVMLVGELARWGVEPDRLAGLLDPVDRALAWIDDHGDVDGDGFVEYERSSPVGLVNQGWKDSWDAVRFHDGTLADSPVALAEVQGYVHAAFVARAELCDLFGDTDGSRTWRQRARDLRRRFDERFWLDNRGWYAMALDGRKRPVDALASNVGHCLWTGIVGTRRRRDVARLLTGDGLSSGFGVRTLAAHTGGYNPVSYHCGAVWPHDSAIALAGMCRAGTRAEAALLARSLLDAAEAFDGRLPELFAGFDRAEFPSPVTYPAACSPQAWASAAPLLVLRSLLGLEPDIPNRVVRVRPCWPDGISQLRVEGIWLAGHRVTIDARPGSVEVTGLRHRDIRIDRG
jgi:glycogen debranching enzyme